MLKKIICRKSFADPKPAAWLGVFRWPGRRGRNLTQALVREIQEETGVTVEVNELVGVYSYTHSHTVMFGFLCAWLEGKPVTNPALYDRLRDMLDFHGTVVYRDYVRTPETYLVQEEREL